MEFSEIIDLQKRLTEIAATIDEGSPINSAVCLATLIGKPDLLSDVFYELIVQESIEYIHRFEEATEPPKEMVFDEIGDLSLAICASRFDPNCDNDRFVNMVGKLTDLAYNTKNED